MWFFFVVPLWIYFYSTRGSRHLENVIFYEKGKREDGRTKIKTYTDADDGVKIFYLIVLVGIVVVGLVSIFAG